MEDFLVGLVMGAVLATLFAVGSSGCPADRLRDASCVMICGKAEAYSSSPAMCVCRDGSTHRGKAPEFYR